MATATEPRPPAPAVVPAGSAAAYWAEASLRRALLWPLLLVAGVAAYLLLPGHPLSLLRGVPLDWLGLAALGGLGCLLFGFGLPAPTRTTRLAALAVSGLLAVKLLLWWSAPTYGLAASYFPRARLTGTPERSTELRGVPYTRVEASPGANGFALHFFNDVERFNYYEAPDPERTALPFAVRWDGYLHAPADGTYELVLTARGLATFTVDGTPRLTVGSRDSVATDRAPLALAAGPRAIRLDFVHQGGPDPSVWLAANLGAGLASLGPPALTVEAVPPDRLARDRVAGIVAMLVDVAVLAGLVFGAVRAGLALARRGALTPRLAARRTDWLPPGTGPLGLAGSPRRRHHLPRKGEGEPAGMVSPGHADAARSSMPRLTNVILRRRQDPRLSDPPPKDLTVTSPVVREILRLRSFLASLRMTWGGGRRRLTPLGSAVNVQAGSPSPAAREMMSATRGSGEAEGPRARWKPICASRSEAGGEGDSAGGVGHSGGGEGLPRAGAAGEGSLPAAGEGHSAGGEGYSAGGEGHSVGGEGLPRTGAAGEGSLPAAGAIHPVERPLLAGLLLAILAYALVTTAPLEGRAAILEGGQDWLTYESYARDILLNGPLMMLGEPLGKGKPFFFQPFYPYYLAGLHWLTGEGVWGPIVLQIVGVGVSGVVTYSLARQLFGRPAAVLALAAFLVLGLSQLDWIARKLLSENLYFVVLPAALLFVVRAVDRRRISDVACAGLLLGICAVTRAPTLLFVPGAALCVALAWRRAGDGWRRAATAFVLLGLLTALVAALVPIRNYVVSGRPALVATNGGATLLLAHQPTPSVSLRGVDRDPLYNRLKLDRATREVVEFARQDPVGYVWTLVPLGLYSVGISGAVEGFPSVAPDVLAITLLYVVAVAVLPAARTLRTWPLHLFIVIHLAIMMTFLPYVYGYRQVLPMQLLMLPFVGAVLVAAVNRLRGRWRVPPRQQPLVQQRPA